MRINKDSLSARVGITSLSLNSKGWFSVNI